MRIHGRGASVHQSYQSLFMERGTQDIINLINPTRLISLLAIFMCEVLPLEAYGLTGVKRVKNANENSEECVNLMASLFPPSLRSHHCPIYSTTG